MNFLRILPCLLFAWSLPFGAGPGHAGNPAASRGASPADRIGEAQSKALQDMRDRAVVGAPPVWPPPARKDSMPKIVITSDDSLLPNPDTGFVLSEGQAIETTDPDMSADSGAAPTAQPPPGAFGELRFALAFADDFEMGGRFGAQIAHPGLPLDLFFDFEGRPLPKAVRVPVSDTLEYQFQEHRFTPSLGLSSRIPLGSASAFWTVGGGVGVSFGYYRGSNRSAEVTFPVWMETGYRFKLSGGSYWGLGYQYFPLPFASSHRVTFVYGIRGPDKEDR